MQETAAKPNARDNKIQDVISDDLFPTVQHISDVKQVLEFMQPNAKALREEQVRALLYLEALGNDPVMHPDGNPYTQIIKQIVGTYREKVADPEMYLDTIEALIPKPPKPILMNEQGQFKKITPAK
jgi:hypothetical protein